MHTDAVDKAYNILVDWLKSPRLSWTLLIYRPNFHDLRIVEPSLWASGCDILEFCLARGDVAGRGFGLFPYLYKDEVYSFVWIQLTGREEELIYIYSFRGIKLEHWRSR